MGTLLSALAAFALGCAGGPYFYQPAEQANAVISGHPAAHYTIPPTNPQGDVRVAAFGVAKLEFEDRDETVHALHIQLIIANNSGRQTWALDTRGVQVQFAGNARKSSPAYANSSSAGLPVVQIPPGESRTVDLYYPLPAHMEDEGDLPRFDVLWSVETDDGMVTERTPFERREVVPPAPTVYYGWGAPYWWYDPFFTPYPRGYIHTVPPPRIYYHRR
jgi:hypothetical protein